ncbi:MAG: iron-only hydrogenase system regulator [Planctomycetia bacterium]|nr:iron-only hydrogenase system regulator [Planctomycetia bacterium]
MENRLALIGIIVENRSHVERLNAILHQFSKYIVGRMGIPYTVRDLSVISVVVDAPAGKISALSGKIGMLDGINVKTMYARK